MNEIRKILNIINEIDINSNKENIDRIRSIYSSKIYEIYHSHKELTNDYTNSWIHVYSYEKYNELQNVVNDLYDIINELSPKSQLYEVLTSLYHYYCE